jgi:ATP-dependent Clp protease ATP-binding subunit ClpC
MSMWEPFNERARRSIVLAQEEAQRLQDHRIGTEHFLLGIIGEGGSIAVDVLNAHGVDLEKTRREVEANAVRDGGSAEQEMYFTPRAKRVIELAFEEARMLNHNYMGPESILLGIVREGAGLGARVLENLGVDTDELRSDVIARLKAEGGSRPIHQE